MTETYIEMLQNLELSKEDLEEKIYKCAKETIEGFQKLYLNKKEILSLFNTSEHNNESWERVQELTGLVMHTEKEEQRESTVKEPPKILIEAYKIAKNSDIILNFFTEAFNPDNNCIEARYRTLTGWMMNSLY